MDAAWLARLGRAALPIVAGLVFFLVLAGVLASAGTTLGFDFLSYRAAAFRVLDGRPLYDLGFQAAGGFGLFYYPPMFAPLILPFGLLSESVAIWSWIVLLVASFLAGVAILPVSRTVRWWIALLAGTGFLFAYAVKLGQVGPILFLLFAIGWRWLENQPAVGVTAALGTAIKLQPAILFVWALLARRWVALLVGAVVLALLSVAATLLAGPGAWTDFLGLLGRVADPITTPRNASPGAAAYQLGAPVDVAGAIQLATVPLVLVALVVSERLATDEASYLVAVIASQLLSPVLWDHYAMLLLLPVAYLLAGGHWWALVLPLVTAAPLLFGAPSAVYPASFALALVAVLTVGVRARRRSVGA